MPRAMAGKGQEDGRLLFRQRIRRRQRLQQKREHLEGHSEDSEGRWQVEASEPSNERLLILLFCFCWFHALLAFVALTCMRPLVKFLFMAFDNG